MKELDSSSGMSRYLWRPAFPQSSKETFFFLFGFSKIGFLCVAPSFPGTHSVDQAVLKLTEIHLPLPPKCLDLRCAHNYHNAEEILLANHLYRYNL